VKPVQKILDPAAATSTGPNLSLNATLNIHILEMAKIDVDIIRMDARIPGVKCASNANLAIGMLVQNLKDFLFGCGCVKRARLEPDISAEVDDSR
jgi:hypothetical protein